MSEKNSENLPIGVKKSTIVFDDAEENESAGEHLPIKEAEILDETKRPAETTEAQPAEPEDEFAQLIAKLPSDCNPTLLITRQPDRQFSGKWRTLCESQSYEGSLNWNNYKEPSEIYDDIGKQFGGGRFTIQIKDGQRMEKGKTVTVNIADPTGLSVKEETALKLRQSTEKEPAPVFQSQPEPIAAAPVAPVDPLDNFLNTFTKFKQINEMMTPAPTAAAAPEPAPTIQAPVTRQTIQMAVVEAVLKGNNQALIEKTLVAALDISPDTPEASNGVIGDTISFIVQHPSESKTALDIVVSTFAGVAAKFFPGLTQPAPPAQLIQPRIIPPGRNPLEQFKAAPDAPAEAPPPKNQPQAKQAQPAAPPAASVAPDFPFIELN